MNHFNKITSAAAIFFAILLSACTNTHDKLTQEILEKEKVLFKDKDVKMNTKTAREVISQYRYFAEKFPDDSMAAEYLFKAGDVSSGINAYTNALEFFSAVSQKYPQSNKAAYALFLQGYINENNLYDTAKAKQLYNEFVAKYPTHEMAESAKFSLENLGKTPEQIIAEFSKQDSLSSAEAK